MAVLKRVGILKTATFFALYTLFMAIIMELFIGLFPMILSALFLPFGFVSLGLLFFILFPIIFALISFISTLIMALIINLVLKITKGINFDLELGGQMY